MIFHVKVTFLHKSYITKEVEEKDGFTAIKRVLSGLDSVEKDNIKGANITCVN